MEYRDRYRRGVAPELYIRRLPVEEALRQLDRYLDDAFLAGLYQVRVVHGKGAGTLRRLVREHLARHVLVQSYREGDYGEGGGGVTIVEMASKY